jgi:Spy/CpxP family protein refolding chaperone
VFRHSLGALALVAALALPFVASAQTSPGSPAPGASAPAPSTGTHHGHRRRNGFMRVMRDLNLTDAQKQQIAGIMKNSRATNQGITDPQTLGANRLAMRRQIEGVLTDAQRTQLRAKLAQAHQRGKRSAPAPQASPQ